MAIYLKGKGLIENRQGAIAFLAWISLELGMAGMYAINPLSAIALPPPEDTPEEVLRTEIILEARSPVDGESLTASEYVALQAALAEPGNPESLDAETRQLIFLLEMRQFLNIVLPFPVF